MQTQCAGKRRRHSKKHGRKTRKHRGGYYGAAGPIAPGAMQWASGSEMGDWAVSSRGGNAQYGSGRKRKTRRRGGAMARTAAELKEDLNQDPSKATLENVLSDLKASEKAEVVDLARQMEEKLNAELRDGETMDDRVKKIISSTRYILAMAGGKRRKTRKHRGGSRFGAVAASYQGSGSRGMADFVATNTKVPPFGPAAGGAFNNAGAQPGSGYGSFVKAA